MALHLAFHASQMHLGPANISGCMVNLKHAMAACMHGHDCSDEAIPGIHAGRHPCRAVFPQLALYLQGLFGSHFFFHNALCYPKK